MPHILIVEDEPSIAQSLEYVLQTEGFTTHWVTLAHEALVLLRKNTVGLVILDVGLPDMTGFEMCKQVRQFSQVPVMFLTARGDEIDRIVGLEIGADDYVVKPFSPREVAARAKAILKRMQPATGDQTFIKSMPVNAAFTVNVERCMVDFLQQPLPLTKVEYVIFKTLLGQPGRVFSRAQLLEALGGPQWENYERAIDTHIKAIRAKLRAVGAPADAIKTTRGFGYSAS